MPKNQTLLYFTVFTIGAAIITRALFLCSDWTVVLSQDFWLDDSFYYLQIAKQWITINKLTFDGTNPTNGFQPLYLLLISPIMYLAGESKILPIFLCNILLSLFSLGSLYIFYKIHVNIGIKKTYSLISTLILILNPYILINSVNGLETGVAIFFALLTFNILITFLKEDSILTNSQIYFLGISIGLSLLARIDLLFLFVAIFISLFSLRDIYSVLKKPLTIFKLVFSSGLICIPWWTYSFFKTGYILPQSGKASRVAALTLGWETLSNYFPNMSSDFSYLNSPLSYKLSTLVKLLHQLAFDCFVALPFRIDVGTSAFENPNQSVIFRYLLAVGPIIFSILILLGILLLFISTITSKNQNNFKLLIRRSTLAYILMMIFAYSFLVPTHWYFARYFCLAQVLFQIYAFTYLENKSFLYTKNIGLCLITLGGLYLISPIRKLPYKTSAPTGFYADILNVSKVIPKDSIIGSFQSGIMTWFSDFRIINLDGKCNQLALDALNINSLGEYVYNSKIDYILDWDVMVNSYLITSNKYSKLDLKEVHLFDSSTMKLYKVIRY